MTVLARPRLSRLTPLKALLPAKPLLALAPLLVLAACQEQKAAEAPKPERPVLAERVRFTPLSQDRSFVATVRPRIESDLHFRVAGKIARRLVSAGDRVEAGQALATLDETDFALQREQAEAERTAAAASLTNAEAELRRISTLRGEGWSTAVAFDRQKAATEEAKGRAARAERAVSLARNAHSYATLTADAPGVVTATLAEPGQVVATTTVVMRLARLAEREAVVAVPEVLVGGLREAKASVSLWSNPDRRYPASLRELSPTADPATRTYAARFSIEGAGDEAQLGMTATVTVSGRDDAKVARLPLSALYNQGGGASLWVVDVDGRLTLRPVSVHSYGAREVLVGSGVAEGDQVVTLGVQKLDGGQRVKIVQALQF